MGKNIAEEGIVLYFRRRGPNSCASCFTRYGCSLRGNSARRSYWTVPKCRADIQPHGIGLVTRLDGGPKVIFFRLTHQSQRPASIRVQNQGRSGHQSWEMTRILGRSGSCPG